MFAASEIFSGAAPYYARHAVPYPEDVFRSLIRLCRLTTSTRVLDLGAGTGQIGLPLAQSVGNVFSVDPSSEMVEEGRRMASTRGVNNLDFLVSTSENLQLPASSFDLATIALSFHWMDRAATLAKLSQIVKPDGCVAIIDRVREHSEPGEWYNAMVNDITDFWGGSLPAGPGGVRSRLTGSHREVLGASDFNEITELRHDYQYQWIIDDLLGWLSSTAMGAPGTLGPRREGFLTRVRQLLLSHSPSGSFMDRGHITTLIGYRSRSKSL
ncbi:MULTISPECIES: class I SAM-dependent methyltransferase [Bradyrhizobium]|uniref:class I SAM-dependent methyltransferase n=1 Tax=Bradyrhizobium TaxID=374 RepID=UPI00248B8F05|nr:MULTISPECIES: class I SAM-dependent methyltransferase [Bradyrhizobium]MDI2110558.1 methyltransferase domain-containing protein [Bradyrhizobium sp. Mp64]WLA46651.1 methyltransferase domain-containing protein [Bradyrhizobium elkanii]WLB83062.1 methyltransferase domain-containing protein [Bradyrhizobium elkanii]